MLKEIKNHALIAALFSTIGKLTNLHKIYDI